MKLKNELEKWKAEFAKLRQMNSKLESDLRDNRKLVEQLATVNFNLSARDNNIFRNTIWNAKIGKTK